MAGTDKSVAWGDVTLAAYVPHNYPLEDIEPGLEETAFYDPSNFTLSFGSYMRAEVEVDPDTGKVSIERFAAADDFRQHHQPDDRYRPGPWRSGPRALARRCLENCAYDDNGQLLSGILYGLCDAACR